MGASETTFEVGYAKAQLLSAPCRYVVDPLLSTVSTAAALPVICAGGSVYGIWTILTTPMKRAVQAVAPDSPDGDNASMPEAPVVMP